MLPERIWAQAQVAVARCQCLIVVGTSAQVYPAAGLIDDARNRSAKVIEINIASTSATSVVDVCLQGASGKILPELMARL